MHLCDLHVEVLLFLAEINSPLIKHMEEKWVAKLAYLSDVFERIKILNTCLQERVQRLLHTQSSLWIYEKVGTVGCTCEAGVSGNVEGVLARAGF